MKNPLDVVSDEPSSWTVRFSMNERKADSSASSPSFVPYFNARVNESLSLAHDDKID
jgi:hypothetical protein